MIEVPQRSLDDTIPEGTPHFDFPNCSRRRDSWLSYLSAAVQKPGLNERVSSTNNFTNWARSAAF
jgi:hypothetical protein